ncbi:hypothetical protein CYMTET_37271 [Cymbomonas tetramitiformis]|uniref:Uncharacterized protein n=1 Tax=Cymbomonas tetramitiformis TaxID=36881 RepID=A0AAE0CFV0_9CHLO|nr:hypothetical protein CYMTET_37271 [Cymbomonas tetramitiformis]
MTQLATCSPEGHRGTNCFEAGMPCAEGAGLESSQPGIVCGECRCGLRGDVADEGGGAACHALPALNKLGRTHRLLLHIRAHLRLGLWPPRGVLEILWEAAEEDE